MPIAWHPSRWWDCCVSEDEKKETDPMFIKELWKCVLVVYNTRVLGHFTPWEYLNQFSIKIIHKDLI